jgi:hypothetical protein
MRAGRPHSGIGEVSKQPDRSSTDVHSGAATPTIAAIGIGPK